MDHRLQILLVGDLLLAGLLVPLRLPAQQGPAPQAIDPQELRVNSSPYSPPSHAALGTEVRLVEILAVVRDAKGLPVPGLTRAQFEVRDEGKKRDLTAFSVQQAEMPTAVPAQAKAAPAQSLGPAAAPAAQPSARTIAMFFDDLNSNPEDFQHVRDAALRFVNEGLIPGDRVGVFTTFSSQVLPFTSDVTKLAAAIAKLNPRQRIGNDTVTCPYLTPYLAYLLANKLDYEALAAKEDEMKACDPQFQSSSASKGSRNQKQPPPPEPNWQDPIALKIVMLARSVWEEQEVTSKDTLGTIENVVDLMAAQPGQHMLLLGSGGFLAGTLQTEEQTLITHAVHAGVVINSLDAKGLYAIDLPTSVVPGGVTGRGSAYAAKLGSRPKDAANDVMENLSASTGGQFFRNSNDLAGGFAKLTEIPEVSYLLGFSPPDPDGKFHRLKVLVSGGKGFTIQARQGYMSENEPSHAPRPDRKIDREVFTAVQSHDAPVGMNVTAEPSPTGATILRAVFHADVRTLPFVDQAGLKTEKLSFLVAVLDKDGNFVSGKEGSMDFALKQATFERLQGTRLDANLQLDMPPAGTYRLRVLIEDGNGGKMTEATQPVRVQ